jgi:hypothetical protein
MDLRTREMIEVMNAVVVSARALRECALKVHGDCDHTQAVAAAVARLDAMPKPEDLVYPWSSA